MSLPYLQLPPGERRALIVLSGDLPPAQSITGLISLHDVVVAADGAALILREYGITPDVVIGDLDSLGDDLSAMMDAGIRIVEEPDQERNDFEKALLWTLEQATDSATIVGMFGGMPDHAINNLSIFARFARRMPLVTFDHRCIGYAVVHRLALDAAIGERISLLPLPRATVTTSGLEWPLDREDLAFGVREGASNRAVAHRVEIEVRDGVLLVMHWPAGGAV